MRTPCRTSNKYAVSCSNVFAHELEDSICPQKLSYKSNIEMASHLNKEENEKKTSKTNKQTNEQKDEKRIFFFIFFFIELH